MMMHGLKCRSWASSCFALTNCLVSAQEPSSRPSLETLRRTDEQTLREYTLKLAVESPFSMRGQQDNYVKHVDVTVNSESTAIVWETTSLPAPIYFPPGTPGYQDMDYDDLGNLIVIMPVRGATVRTRQVHESSEEYVGFLTNSSGVAIKSPAASSVTRYKSTDENTLAVTQLRCWLWAIGRGLSGELNEPLDVAPQPDGLARLRAARLNRGQRSAIWEVLLDEKAEGLVRSADELDERVAWVTKEVRTKGTKWFGNVAFAEVGTTEIVFSPKRRLRFTVTIEDFVPKFDPSVLEKAQVIVAETLTSEYVRIIDQYTDPNRPTVQKSAFSPETPDPE